MVSIAEWIAHDTGRDPLALPWLMVPLLVVAGMVIVSFVRPDPKVIGHEPRAILPGLHAAGAATARGWRRLSRA